MLNSLILFDDWKIQKPKVSLLLENINLEITKNYFTDEGSHNGHDELYDYYFKKSSILKKELNYVNKENINLHDKIYYVCLNHAEMHVGLDKTIQNQSKCNKQILNFNIVETKEIKDFKIILYEKR